MAETKNGAAAVQEPATSTALVLSTVAFEPRNMDEGLKLATVLHKGGLLPASIRSAEAAFTIIAAGREFGFTAMQSLRSIYFFDGKIVMAADLMVAIARKHPDCEYFQLIETSATSATFETKRKGDPKPTKLSFTIEEAQKAGLLSKNNWKNYPAAMLRARAEAALCRVVYQDKLAACYDPDELNQEPMKQVQVETRVVPSQPHDEVTGEIIDEAYQLKEADRLARLMDVAKDAKGLRAAGTEVKASFEKGKISEIQRTTLAVYYEERKKAVAAAAAEPAPAAPAKSEPRIKDAEFEEDPPADKE